MLKDLKCSSIDKTLPPMSLNEIKTVLTELPGWSLNNLIISREFQFKDFVKAMEFVNKTADLANIEDHHPDIFISYNKVRIDLSTHKIGGLSMNDFILAAKIEAIIFP